MAGRSPGKRSAGGRAPRSRTSRATPPAACRFCGGPFRPRTRANIYCPRKTCRRKRRHAYMRKYMKAWRERHPDYWKTERQREYLRRWREDHPDYFKRYTRKTRGKGRGVGRTRRRRKAKEDPS